MDPSEQKSKLQTTNYKLHSRGAAVYVPSLVYQTRRYCKGFLRGLPDVHRFNEQVRAKTGNFLLWSPLAWHTDRVTFHPVWGGVMPGALGASLSLCLSLHLSAVHTIHSTTVPAELLPDSLLPLACRLEVFGTRPRRLVLAARFHT